MATDGTHTNLGNSSRDLGLSRPSAIAPVTRLSGAAESGNAGLFVGVACFDENSGLTKLRFTVSDAIALCHTFVIHLGLLPPSQVSLAIDHIPEPEPRELAELRDRGVRLVGASRNELLKEIKRVANIPRSPEDLVVVTFSSHGFEKDHVAYIMPSDGDASLFTETGVSLRTVERVLRNNANATKHILIIDACRERSEGETKGDARMSGSLRDALKESEGTAVLASCDVGQLSWEARDLGAGVYTHFLLEGLRGAAVGARDEFLRLGQVSAYAAKMTSDWVSRQRGQKQVPWFEGESARDIPLAVNLSAVRQAEAEQAAEQERIRQEAIRRTRSLEVIGKAFALDWPGFDIETVQEIRSLIQNSPDKSEELLRRIEKLYAEGEGYAEDFILWWAHKQRMGAGPSTQSGSYRAPSSYSAALPSSTDLGLDSVLASVRVNEELLQSARENWQKLEQIELLPPEALAPAKRIHHYQSYIEAFGSTGHQIDVARQRIAKWQNPGPAALPSSATSPGPRNQLEAGARKELILAKGVAMAFRWCPSGTFLMGSPDTEEGRASDEGPQTTVVLTSGFWLGETPVTQLQYLTLMGKNPSHFVQEAKAGGLFGLKAKPKIKPLENHPVEQISWDDAIAFCQSASQVARTHVTLPTEAQWEYACRAGGKTRFFFGDSDDEISTYAWHAGNSGNSTQPVGQKRPNGWGLHDMHGNVWQWCLDRCGLYSGGKVTNPTGPPSGTLHVLRGGSWDYSAVNLRSANRDWYPKDDQDRNLGFRVVING